MRSRLVVIVGVVVAVCAAAVGVAIAIAASVGGSTTAGTPSPTASQAAEQVSADDFCYVEAMIYYRVEAVDLAEAVLDKTGISSETRAFAEDIVAAQSAELQGLRPWYVSWTGARPLERPQEGPCAGHGVTHAQMPGLPTPSEWDALTAADGADAERMYLELMTTQDTAMVDFARLVLQGDPHSRVRASAEQVIAQGNEDIATLGELIADAP